MTRLSEMTDGDWAFAEQQHWMAERPEPILADAMATEAAIERRRALDDEHPLDCRCRDCHQDERDDLLPYFGPEDDE